MKNLHFKNLFKVLFITVCVIITLPLTNCIHPLDYSELLEFKASVYPSTSDFFIDGLGTYLCGEEYAITVAPKPDMTQGGITIFYEGYNYERSDTPPDSAGAYTVTFDVGKAKGFYAVSGMVAGLLMINNPVYAIPQKEDFNINGLGPYTLGDTVNVTVVPNPGKTQGHLTIYYERYDYPVSVTPPRLAGAYTVTFNVDVDDDGQFNAAYGLFAGTLIINNPNPPTVDDFIINGVGLEYKLGDPVTVTVEPKDDRLEGKVTIFYEGYNHPRSKDVPNAVGAYTVTFDVAAVDGHSVAAYGLMAGSITIYEPVYPIPVVEDFNIIGCGEFLENGTTIRRVTITPLDSNVIKGAVTVYYNGSLTAPKTFGIYNITFNVAEAPGYNKGAQGLLAGLVIIHKKNAELIGYKDPDDPYALTSDDFIPTGVTIDDRFAAIVNIIKENPDAYFSLDLTNTGGLSYGSMLRDTPGVKDKITSITLTLGNGESVYFQFFKDFPALETVRIIGNGNNTVSGSVFQNCTALESVYIENVNSITGNAFDDCPKLKYVTINGCQELGNGFRDCPNIREVEFWGSVTLSSFSWNYFIHNGTLDSMLTDNVPPAVTKYSSNGSSWTKTVGTE
jgi:hypothetical protein